MIYMSNAIIHLAPSIPSYPYQLRTLRLYLPSHAGVLPVYLALKLL